ncbi:Transglycosylase SLT domain protein [Nonomuraea coxensis DSM 45129]|uniref:Transglycosylase SLT domain protein n=1 Tax=Nonomuraea coxensis DSM 45129 TaxID=1122611 RepID=A0ABX8TVG5_9ACTN|nr:transglycosylase SLT domain-containing protein [Nonomuraea coxensis]QYC38712.1 Transglycosylase SLT domain protein [Nonomuraea coxensis DSM 45129]
MSIVSKLTELLEQVKGDPEAIRDLATAMRKVSAHVAASTNKLVDDVTEVGNAWKGDSATAFATYMSAYPKAGGDLRDAMTTGASSLTTVAGKLEQAYTTVRDLHMKAVEAENKYHKTHKKADQSLIDAFIKKELHDNDPVSTAKGAVATAEEALTKAKDDLKKLVGEKKFGFFAGIRKPGGPDFLPGKHKPEWEKRAGYKPTTEPGANPTGGPSNNPGTNPASNPSTGPSATDPKAEDPKATDPKTEDPKTQDPKAEDPKAEDPKTQDPNAQDPKTQDPNAQDPKTQDPNAQDPNATDPKTQDPNADPSTTDPNATDPNTTSNAGVDPNADQSTDPGSSEPDINAPGVVEPGADPGAAGPATDDPATDPGTDDPAAGDPGTDGNGIEGGPQYPDVPPAPKETVDWIKEALTVIESPEMAAILQERGLDISDLGPNDPVDLQRIWAIIHNESGGDPNFLGTGGDQGPQGLMQTIPSTFEAHHLPGHDNIKDPVDNIIAGVLYIVDKYGGLGDHPGIASLESHGGYQSY